MKLVVNPKNKKQEKALKAFLENEAIDFTTMEEDAAVYKITSKKDKLKAERTDVLEWQKKFVRKSIKKYNSHPELLLSEKEAWAIIESSK